MGRANRKASPLTRRLSLLSGRVRRMRRTPGKPAGRPRRRRPAGKRFPGKRPPRRLLGLALLAAVLAALWTGYGNLRELTGIYGEAQCRNLVTRLMLEAAAESEEGTLFQLERQEDQSLLTLDGAAVRRMQTQAGLILTQKLEALQQQSHQAALGTVADSAFWMDRGPRLTLRFVPVGSAQVQMGSGMQSAGINQVLYQVWMELSVTMTVLLPGGTRTVDCVQRVVVEETLITGKVPLVYAGTGLGQSGE